MKSETVNMPWETVGPPFSVCHSGFMSSKVAGLATIFFLWAPRLSPQVSLRMVTCSVFLSLRGLPRGTVAPGPSTVWETQLSWSHELELLQRLPSAGRGVLGLGERLAEAVRLPWSHSFLRLSADHPSSAATGHTTRDHKRGWEAAQLGR